jgi:RNA polymerase sigma factor (sigma-70 family)
LPLAPQVAGLTPRPRPAPAEPLESDPSDAGSEPVAPPTLRPPGARGPGALMDIAGLGEALRREGPVLLAAARAIVLDDAEAEDLVQATFEIAIRRIGDLREPAALRGWLLTIQAREAFRARRRIRRILRLDASASEIPSPPAASADDLAVRDALRHLSPRVRAAIVLHHLAGLPVTEVALALGTSPNTVKSQLRMGLARLRREMDDD